MFRIIPQPPIGHFLWLNHCAFARNFNIFKIGFDGKPLLRRRKLHNDFAGLAEFRDDPFRSSKIASAYTNSRAHRHIRMRADHAATSQPLANTIDLFSAHGAAVKHMKHAWYFAKHSARLWRKTHKNVADKKRPLQLNNAIGPPRLFRIERQVMLKRVNCQMLSNALFVIRNNVQNTPGLLLTNCGF